jgi:hypothetical protein
MPIGAEADSKEQRSADLDVGNRARKEAQGNGTDEHRQCGIEPKFIRIRCHLPADILTFP